MVLLNISAWVFPAISRHIYTALMSLQGPSHPFTLLLSQPALEPAMAFSSLNPYPANVDNMASSYQC